MQHRISSLTTVTFGVGKEKAARLLALYKKREEIKQVRLKIEALQCTQCSEQRDQNIADLKRQVANLQHEEAVCYQEFEDSLKP
jgi:hypothetical protein